MRIIGGDFKRRSIRFPKTKKTRPVMDRVKETIFNVLGHSVEGNRVLDLFAGSGSLGIEALSRGAQSVCFVDKEFSPYRVIRKNLESLQIDRERWRIFKMSAMQAIRYFGIKKLKFDLIFIDPPFNKGWIKKILRLLERFDIVELSGKIVYQRARQENLPKEIQRFHLIQEKTIGQAFVGFMSLEHQTNKETG